MPKTISKALGKVTVHGLLAAELALDKSPARALWRAVLPTRKDLEESMPLFWHSSLQALLPEACAALLSNQKTKLSLDWATVSKAFPQILYEDYIYHWTIVNTRTFYYTPPHTEKSQVRDDCMALNPFADYFNHADSGCDVSFSDTEYKFTTDKSIERGSEIYISYGNHSNDFLLAEYGFILDQNKWDEVYLDTYILPMLSEAQKEHLMTAGFFGKYVLDTETICHRTQVVLRLLCLPFRRWQRFVKGLDDGEKDLAVVDHLLHKVLQLHIRHVTDMLARASVAGGGLASQRHTICRRWEQINLLLDSALMQTRG